MTLDKDDLYINTLIGAFWVRCTFGFLCEEIIPPLHSLMFSVYFLFDIVIFGLGIIALTKKSDKIFFWAFIAAGLYITCIDNGYSLLFFVNGLRDFVFMLLLIPIFRFIYDSEERYKKFKPRFDRTLYIFLWVQVFCLTWQFVKYGANDHGGGSLGNYMSGIISTMIYLISFYLMKQRMDPSNYFQSLKDNKILIFLLFPTFLNETKISFIFLLFYFIFLMPINRKLIVRMLIMIPVLLGGLYVAMLGYLTATGNDDDILSLDYYTEMYLFSEDIDDAMNWAEYLYDTEADILDDLPRFTKFVMIPEMNDMYPGHEIFGYGVGQFKGGTTIPASKFYEENEWILRGSVPYLFHMFIQMGWLCIPFFAWFLVNLFRFKPKGSKFDKGMVLYFSLMIALIMFYNDSLRNAYMVMVMIYVLLETQTGKKPEEETPEESPLSVEKSLE